MKLLYLITTLIRNLLKFTELIYHKQRLRNIGFSEHVKFVQICPVFARPVTYVCAPEAQGPQVRGLSVNISDRPQVPMLQISCN